MPNETVIMLGGECLLDLAEIHRRADATFDGSRVAELAPDEATQHSESRRAAVLRRQSVEWSEIRELVLKAARLA